MSSSYNYLPIPPRVWSRVQNLCTYDVSGSTYSTAYIPLTNQTVSQAQANYEEKLLYKGNILQYKANSSQLTKKQKYTQLAKGLGPNRTKVFATQSQTYTNPNTTWLQRKNYATVSFQDNVQSPYGCSTTSIQDGGNLVCGTYTNQCTGQVIKTASSAPLCFPNYCSDVPGYPIELCWNPKVQTWFPRQRYVMNNSGTKWPVNYKALVSAVTPKAPLLTLSLSTITPGILLSWTDINNNCIPISNYNIYQNGVLIQIVPYTIKSTIITNFVCGNYYFYVTSESNNIQSKSSNIVTYNLPFLISSGASYNIDSSNNYTVLFTTIGEIEFLCNVTNLQVVIVGGGGGGAFNNNYESGGGGGGGQAVIPFYTPNLVNKTFTINSIGYAGLGATNTGSNGEPGGSTIFVDPNNISYTVTGGNGGNHSSSPIGIAGNYTGPSQTSYGETISIYGSGGDGGIGIISDNSPTYGSSSYFKIQNYILINTLALGGGGGGSGEIGGEGGSQLGNGAGGAYSNSLNLNTQDAIGYGAGGGAYAGPSNYPPKRGGNGSPGVCIFYFQYP